MRNIIGFLGLGIMGKPMCKNLLKAGHEVIICGPARPALNELSAVGAKVVASPKEIAERAEIVITMLPDSPQVKEAVFGKDGIAEGAKAGMILADMSSIAPLASREIAARLEERGVEMLDAPVSGGQPKAIAGTLSVMVGGKQEVFDRCLPVFKAMASSVVRVGDIGSGNVAKLANQVVAALNMAAVAEALVLAAKAGVEPELVFQAIRTGLAGSAIMDAKVPLMLDHRFDPGFRMNLHIKDLNNALETARQIGSPLTLTATVLEMMRKLESEGLGELDHSALVRHFEKEAKAELRRVSGK